MQISNHLCKQCLRQVPPPEPTTLQLFKIGAIALLAAGGGMGTVVVFIIGGILAFH